MNHAWGQTLFSNRLARAQREFERKQAYGADWDGNVQNVINTYKATECEIDGIRQAAETGINYNAMVLGGGVLRPTGTGLRLGTIQRGPDIFDIVPRRYRKVVQESFDGEPVLLELTEDLIVYRHWGDDATEIGSPWFSPRAYSRPGNAQRYLALPSTNSATKVSQFRIKKGTKVLVGKVGSKAGEEGFCRNAYGGGIQVYLPDPDDAQIVN